MCAARLARAMELTMWAQREFEQQKKKSPARQAHRREEGGALLVDWEDPTGTYNGLMAE